MPCQRFLYEEWSGIRYRWIRRDLESQHVTSRDLCATIEQCRNPDLVPKGGAIAEDFSLALKISAESQEEGDGLYKAHCACM